MANHHHNTSFYINSNPTKSNCTHEITEHFDTSAMFLIAAFALILVIGVLGNSFVMYVFGYRRKKIGRTTTEWLILCLGISDFISTIFNSLLFLYWTVTHHSRWDFGFIGCKIIPAIGPIFTTASSGVILIFAIDRYCAVVNPFKGELPIKTTLIAFGVNIVFSALSYAHYIYTIELNECGRCQSPAVNDLGYGIPNCTLIILRLVIFASVFITTSVRIFSKLRRNENTSSAKSKMTNKAKNSLQSRGIARVLFTIGFVFILLVFPREIFYLVFNMSWLTSEQGIRFNAVVLHINSWLKVMHTANSCANVFIYAHMHSRFRRITLRYMYCCLRWREEFVTSVPHTPTLAKYTSMTTRVSSKEHECCKSMIQREERV